MNQKVFKRRVYIAGLLFAVLAVSFILRLFNLHFSDNIVVSRNRKAETHRGYIRDRNGYLLALSIEKNSLFANPEEVKNPEETAQTVAAILRISPDELLKKLKRKKRFVWIRRMIDDDEAERIGKIGIPGLYFKKEYKRVYPADGLASNIVGFVGIDNNGLAGIEYNFDDDLMGRAQGGGEPPGGVRFGRNITLTIDRYIQHLAEKEIGKALDRYRARQGAVVVLEVKTGRVLAFAKAPGFDPNSYSEYPAFPLRNFSFIDSFEPGSTLKIMSLAAMLERRPAVTRQRYTCNGFIDIADVRINCTSVHGTIGMDDIIRYSCNMGVIQAMKGLRKKDLYDTLKKFRFGTATGIELPGETAGILRQPDKWSGLSKYSMAIGHEISVTSLQLAAAFAAVANGGVYVNPAIIEAIEERDGAAVKRFVPAVRGRVIRKDTAAQLLRMMRGVVTGGTGQKAASAYFCVAGKTGTSQKFVRAKGYSDRVLASFAGVAPCEDPAVCILIVIDDPADKLSGGQIATPVFAALVDPVLVRMGVGAKRIRGLPPLRSKGAAPFTGTTMPDFTGRILAESLELLVEVEKARGVTYAFHGTGRVYRQKPAAGARLEEGARIDLYLK
ncbi:MAG TPA: penicillin-binding protein [Spirochaetota bacterium]|nr:transpeptidase family protein [Spirochaetota bacterium]HOD13578.1 penicillin-binding protein [Spirochaetota bacterium]HPG49722.1 penicillin-binding protein [Spirochaetota bacterium]HPN10434.1 penicillin-binding protein [Spirochaetota bacterium]